MLLFSLLSVSISLWPHEEQHARFPYPSPSPRVCSNSCPLNQWCHQPSHPLSSPSPQSLPASGSLPESALNTRWIRYCSFSYSISPANAYSAFISFRIDWFDLLKSLLLHHNSKTFFFFWCSAFFMAQRSHPYMTTEKIIALTIRTFVGKVMYVLFNTLSRFVIAFLPRSKLSFNYMKAVTVCSDFGAQENKICHCFYFFPFYFTWNDGTRCHDLSFWNAEF